MGKYVVKKTSTGIKFDLKAGNGEVIANSEVYKSKDQTAEGFEKCKHPKFEVYVDKAGEFRFRLKAANGEIIATGEGYKAKKSCLNGIESIRKNADSEIFEEE